MQLDTLHVESGSFLAVGGRTAWVGMHFRAAGRCEEDRVGFILELGEVVGGLLERRVREVVD